MCVKNHFMFAVCVMLLSEVQAARGAQSRRLQLKGKSILVSPSVKKAKTGSRVHFALEDMIREITPTKEKIKKGKPGSGFSHDAAPAALKKEAQAALAALAEAKKTIVLPLGNERHVVRPIRCELSNAKARYGAPKKRVAARLLCQKVLGELQVATISSTRLNPVQRTDAFSVSKGRK
jgi:hypothetical protein